MKTDRCRQETRPSSERGGVAIRLPKWMIEQLKDLGEIGYVLEEHLVKSGLLKPPDDYDLDK